MSPIGAFIFLIGVFRKYKTQQEAIEFSSPIGAFIFLIESMMLHMRTTQRVFVPYRGFYFLNTKGKDNNRYLKPCFRPLSGLLFS